MASSSWLVLGKTTIVNLHLRLVCYVGFMITQSFKNLRVWQQSRDITIDIYKEFSSIQDYGFRDQIQRASISIMNNIAEGYAKRSDKGLINYLRIARGSAAEVESMLIVSVDLGYVTKEKQTKLLQAIESIGKLLSAFIRKLST